MRRLVSTFCDERGYIESANESRGKQERVGLKIEFLNAGVGVAPGRSGPSGQ